MKRKSQRFVKNRVMSHLGKQLVLGLVTCLATNLCSAASGDPGSYLRNSNWHESLMASIEAIAGTGVEDGLTSFESDTMRGGDAARPIRVPLAGAK